MTVSVHLAGVIGLVVIFLIGTLRPINLGVLALAMTFVVGSLVARELRPPCIAASRFPRPFLVVERAKTRVG